jgi:hypothetical protein
MTTESGHASRRDIGPERDSGSAFQLRPGMSFRDWTTLGSRLGRVSSASAWALGDWLLFGQRSYGRRYRTALRETNLDYQTLRNYAWVASRFDHARRRDGLSFQHHAELASMPEPDQDLWLRRAETEHWSRNELRRRLSLHHSSQRPTAPVPLVMRFEVAAEDERRWRQAAASKHLELQDWLRTVADAAARDELSDAELPAPTPHVADGQVKHPIAG